MIDCLAVSLSGNWSCPFRETFGRVEGWVVYAGYLVVYFAGEYWGWW